jgi:hypothetical protein
LQCSQDSISFSASRKVAASISDVFLFRSWVEEVAYHIDFAAQLRNQIVHSCGDIMGTGWPEALGEALAI